MVTAVIYPDTPHKDPAQITLREPGEDLELKAIAYIGSVLDALDRAGQKRVLGYLTERYALHGR